MRRPHRRSRVALAMVAAVAMFAPTSATAIAPAAPTPEPAGAKPLPASASPAKKITLITGDQVSVGLGRDGKPMVQNVKPAPRPGQAQVAFQTIGNGKSLYVVPADATALIADHRLDLGLFDVAYLAANGYTDDAAKQLPVIVQYPAATKPAALAAQAEALPASTPTHTLGSIHAAAVAIDKTRVNAFWAAIVGQPARSTSTQPKIWLDRKVHASVDQSVEQIGAPIAWAAGLDGTGITVAILDTGIDPTHQDFAGKITDQQNFTDDADTVDHYGHGTHVASIIAGTGAASNGKYTGAAPGAKLMIGKVINEHNAGAESWIIAGMEWAAEHHARIVNMSLGGNPTDGTDPMSEALDELSAQYGTLFVVAAGNNGTDAQNITTPGAASDALTVSAVDKSDAMASFSSRGPRAGDRALKPDLAAPGVDITAARAAGTSLGDPVNDYYTKLSGTSMATPHVAGAAAILAEQHPDWTGSQLKAALMSTAKDDGFTAFEQGSGRVDVARAFSQGVYANGSVDFGQVAYPQNTLISKAITYTNDTDQAVTLTLKPSLRAFTGEAAPAGMLTVDHGSVVVPAHGTASVTATLDPAKGLGNGSHEGAVRAADASGSIQVTTAIGAYDEPATATLTLDTKPPAGATQVRIGSALVIRTDGREDLDDGPSYIAGGSGTASLADGSYAVTTSVSWKDAAGEWNYALPIAPQVDLTKDTTVTFDLTQAKKITVQTPKPTQTYDSWFGFQRLAVRPWQINESVHAQYRAQNYWALPTGKVTQGTLRFYDQHLMGAPPVSMSTTGTAGVALHPQYQSLDPQYPKLAGRRQLPLVYAGHGLPADFAGKDVHGKLVLLSLDDICSDSCSGNALDRVQNAATGGAAGVLAFSATGRAFLDPVGFWPTYPVPTMSIPAAEGAMLVSELEHQKVTIKVDGASTSPYSYSLKFYNDGQIASDQNHVVGPHDVYQIDNQIHADQPAQATEVWTAYRAGDMTNSNDSVALTSSVPQARTEYDGPLDSTLLWQRQIAYSYGPGEESIDIFDKAGKRSEPWGQQPLVPGAGRFSSKVRTLGNAVPAFGLDTTLCQACRTVDTFTPMSVLTDGQPNHESSESWYPVQDANGNISSPDEVHLYRADGQEVPLVVDKRELGCVLIICLYFVAPTYTLTADSSTYRLVEHHPTPFPDQRYAGAVDTAWTFTSKRATGTAPTDYNCWGQLLALDTTLPCRAEHLLYLGYDFDLGMDNTVPAGTSHPITITGYHNVEVTPEPAVTAVKLSVTFDNGGHWHNVSTSPVGGNKYTATIDTPAYGKTDGTVGIRTQGKDAEGNTIDQTVYHAFGVSAG